VTRQHPRLHVDQTRWYKAMAPKAMHKAARKVPKRSAAKRPGVKQAPSPKPVEFDDLPDRPSPSSNLAALLSTVLNQPDKWMATPNHQLGGRKPSDLVGTAEETKIFDLLHAVDHGLF
jgi:uncharacterized protein (DUF2384 family)